MSRRPPYPETNPFARKFSMRCLIVPARQHGRQFMHVWTQDRRRVHRPVTGKVTYLMEGDLHAFARRQGCGVIFREKAAC